MERRSEKLTEALPYIKVPILFRIIEMYCPKNIWIYWEILIFILNKRDWLSAFPVQTIKNNVLARLSAPKRSGVQNVIFYG